MKKHSLTRQVTSIVSLLVAGAILLCWVLNTTLLPRYYMHNKKELLMENYQTISNASAQDELESDEFAVTFDNLCSNGNIMALILQQDGKVLRSSVNDLDALRTEFWDVLLHGDKMEVLYSNDQYQLLRKTDTRLDSEYLVLVGVLENGDMVLMRTAVESIRESAAISNRFLLFAGAAAIVASLLVAFFTTRHITRPLQQLTDISKRMVDLDFNAKYESNQSNSYEVEELGNHINRLSENLERTISELKTANVELQDDIEKKIQIDEMRKEFLSNVSHELKTPLALIQGYAEGLQECINDDAESREFYCDVIIDEADKMNRMVKKLLTLNQLEFGNDQVIMERFDMTELIRGVANSTKILMEQKGIRLELEDSEEAWVWGDEFKVEEVITNYMSNAINHADGEKLIRVFYTRSEDKLRVSVFNTGQPIPEEDIDKIWVKFYKVDKARTREYGGSGIGLSIVKAIMDSFHQQCGVINHEDGVEFWMELGTK
ncbi:cell wall metabolism sensor histidine kinase WalK [uncultured Eubacterium sp.]|uniref:sensor histidine kinase n=1 Tax=uncultured Eubacterium sp. TaxID=165185 RepID=UPI0025CC061B|nr:HAMP domain-containing sensor histidine kinase [uncultured Eubacterium sp.]MCI6536498.1 HAMP domain-containing histidine kinase [Lachnospiraceae bacterium]